MRENGGQSTHAAIWAAMAFAKLGDSDRAWELFNLLKPVHHGDSPEAIATYNVQTRHHQTVYHITLTRDPNAPDPEPLHLLNDHREHHVEVRVHG